MARRNKRASMREGPLADLFRSTGADAPEDPPEAPGAFFDQEQLEPAAEPPAREKPAPREDPVAREPEPPAPAPLDRGRDDEPPQATEPAPERLNRVFAEEPRPRQTREEF